MMKFACLFSMGWTILLTACATPPIPYKAPVAVTPPTGRVAVSETIVLLDASGSQELVFADGKATLESIVAAMPNGDYQAGHLAFGGFKREATGVSRFDRAKLGMAAKNTTFLEGTTPIVSILEREVTDAVGGGSGKAAIVLISDGIATDYAGRSGVDEETIEAARVVVAGRNGQTCFHAVQLGESVEGGALLRRITEVTPCGSFRNASSLGTAAALQAFSREAYLGGPATARPVAVSVPAAADGDADGDGVADALDACPKMLRQAKADGRGCWTIQNLQFDVNGSGINETFNAGLEEAVAVLAANPNTRVRIDGHTDSDGSAEYNQMLSEKRAEAVREYFVVKGGLAMDRFEVEGFGESEPAVPNDSRANKKRNRRVELTILD